jgi:hypothetical protein
MPCRSSSREERSVTRPISSSRVTTIASYIDDAEDCGGGFVDNVDSSIGDDESGSSTLL